jgi:hypothetical protein
MNELGARYRTNGPFGFFLAGFLVLVGPVALSGQDICNDEEGCAWCITVWNGGMDAHYFPTHAGGGRCSSCGEVINDLEEGAGSCSGCHTGYCTLTCYNHYYCYPEEDAQALSQAVVALDVDGVRAIIEEQDLVVLNWERSAVQVLACVGTTVAMHLPVPADFARSLRN